MILATLWSRVATAAVVAPTTHGVTAVAQSVGILGICSACAAGFGFSDRFIQLDYSMNQSGTEIARSVSKTFVRCLIMPGLVEEVLWRVLLQPPGSTVMRTVIVNLLFTAYHIVGCIPLSEKLDNRVGARDIFSDASFLSLAFLLGNLCSYAYVQSGYALWAPVVAHAVPVTIWLALLGGDEALSTAGGLAQRNMVKARERAGFLPPSSSTSSSRNNGSSNSNE